MFIWSLFYIHVYNVGGVISKIAPFFFPLHLIIYNHLTERGIAGSHGQLRVTLGALNKWTADKLILKFWLESAWIYLNQLSCRKRVNPFEHGPLLPIQKASCSIFFLLLSSCSRRFPNRENQKSHRTATAAKQFYGTNNESTSSLPVLSARRQSPWCCPRPMGRPSSPWGPTWGRRKCCPAGTKGQMTWHPHQVSSLPHPC